MKDNDNDKDVFNLIMFISTYNEKVYDSCKITGVYYIDQDRSIKCEVIKK